MPLVRVVTIPSSDAELASEAQRIAERIPTELPIPEALSWYRLAIRRVYPTAVVREQDELARVEGSPPVWYVTRVEHHFRIDSTLWVPLPPIEAWRLYVDRVVDWQVSVALTPVPPRGGMGREYIATYQFLGRAYHGRLRILSAEPGRFVSIEAAGSGITVWYVTSFTAERDGSQVRVKGDYELPHTIIARVADRIGLERTIGRDIDRANASYRALCLEAAAERPTPTGR
jgi:hypothetical protein